MVVDLLPMSSVNFAIPDFCSGVIRTAGAGGAGGDPAHFTECKKQVLVRLRSGQAFGASAAADLLRIAEIDGRLLMIEM